MFEKKYFAENFIFKLPNKMRSKIMM